MNRILSAVPTTIPGLPGGSIPYFPSGSGSSSAQLGGSGLTSSGGLGLGSFLGAFVGILAVLVVLILIGIFVIVVVANRAEPDRTGHRPQTVYFFAVSFITIIVSIIGSTVVVSALVRFIGSHSSSIADSVARTAVLGGLITVVGMTLLVTHLRGGLALALAETESTNPSRRVGQSYVSAIAFVAVLLLLVVTVLSVYLVCAIAGPGVFGSFGGRAPSLRYLIDAVYLGAVASVILLTHRNLVPPGLRFSRHSVGMQGFSGQPSAAAPPSPPPT